MLNVRARIRARIKVACLTCAGFIVSAGPGMGPASAQGLFEALFGIRSSEPMQVDRPRQSDPSTYSGAPRQQRPHQSQRNASRTKDAPHRRAAKTKTDSQVHERRTARPAATEVARPAPPIAPQVMPGPLGRFLRDPTLQAGDVVATSDGLMVFRGSSKARHSERDFVPLSGGGALVAPKVRTELAQLNRAIDTSDEPAVATGSSPIVAQDEGNKIRR